MAKTTLQVSIPEPCHEDWAKMTPTQCGAFCQACQKEVIDFSRMSEAEIVDRLSKASGKVCGRIPSTMLNRELVKHEPDAAWYSWKKWAVAAGVLLGVGSIKAALPSVSQIRTEKVPIVPNERDTTETKAILITGIVTDANNVPIPSVRVRAHKTAALTETDSAGRYIITLHPFQYLQQSVILIAERDSFITVTKNLPSTKNRELNFVMPVDISVAPYKDKQPNIHIVGRITDVNNFPMAGVKVSAYKTTAQTESDSTGSYLLTLEPYQYQDQPILIIAELDSFVTMTQPVAMPSNNAIDFTMRVDEPFEIMFTGNITSRITPKQKIALAFRKFGWKIDQAFCKPDKRD